MPIISKLWSGDSRIPGASLMANLDKLVSSGAIVETLSQKIRSSRLVR